MKVTVQINNEPVEITLTQEQLAKIEASKKSKKFEWEYNKPYCISAIAIEPTRNSHKLKNIIEHGRYRKTREAAEKSLLRNKRANRLEALAEQLGGLKRFEFNQPNWHVVKADVLWKEYQATLIFEPEKVYMTKECAIEICRMLNEGEFSLDGELE